MLFKVVKWTVKEKLRMKWALSLLGIVVVALCIKKVFFTNMEFIQSEVYSNLYLVKHPAKNQDSLRMAVRSMAMNAMRDTMTAPRYKMDKSQEFGGILDTGFRFYEYYNASPFIPFGEAGTAHFIENEEDLDGFINESLMHYSQYLIADFKWMYCEKDTSRTLGVLKYYKAGNLIANDTLVNQCQNNREHVKKETVASQPDISEEIIDSKAHFRSDIRPYESLSVGKVYIDTISFSGYNDDYDYKLIQGKKDKKNIALIYNWDWQDNEKYNFKEGDLIKITWKMDRIIHPGDEEFIDYGEWVIGASQVILDSENALYPTKTN